MSGPLSNPFMFKSAAGAGNFYTHQIANSCRFLLANSSYMHRTPSSAGNRRTWTFSTWIKRTKFDINTSFFGATRSGYENVFRFDDEDNVERLNTFGFTGASTDFNVKTTASYRDPSAWMHIVIAMDTTQGTDSNRLKLYVNGQQQTDLANNTYPSQNYDTNVNDTSTQTQVGFGSYGGQYFDGYMAESVLIDGTQYAASDFGETKNGVWIPKDPSGLTFGTNGFYLKYESSSDLGNDSSGNNNDLTVSGLSAHDQMLDSPTFNSDSNGGNYCTYNPLQEQGSAQKLMTLSEGNLLAKSETNDKYHQTLGNMGVKTGKWYIEWYIVDDGYPSFSVGWHHGTSLGLYNGNAGLAGNMQYMGYFTGSNVYISAFGVTDTGNPQVAHSSFTNQGAPATDDIIMCAIDMDAGKCWWGINGVWGDIGSGTGNPATGANASATWTIADYPDHKFPFTLAWANPDTSIIMNCGQDGTFAGSTTAGGNADDTGYGNFKYDVPAGFLSLNTGNLPIESEIDPAQTSSDYPQKLFSATTYSGNDTTNNITGVGFQPDLMLFKIRNTASSGMWVDTNRGRTKAFYSINDGAEVTIANITSIDSDGFSLDGTSDYKANFNGNGNTYVTWAWRANAGTTSTNSTGTVNATQQVDPSGGFSLSTYAGSGSSMTVGHGLSSEPKLTIIKDIGSAVNWIVYTKIIDGSLDYLFLNTTAAAADSGLTGPNSSIWNFNSVSSYSNTSGRNYVMFNFTDIEGHIKVGKYTGNASTDNAFVYTGFRPAFVLTKGVNSGDGWNIHDNAISPFNLADTVLQVNIHNAELSNYNIDMLSNGFKVRDADGDLGAARTYIYLAMAHNPFKYATAR